MAKEITFDLEQRGRLFGLHIKICIQLEVEGMLELSGANNDGRFENSWLQRNGRPLSRSSRLRLQVPRP